MRVELLVFVATSQSIFSEIFQTILDETLKVVVPALAVTVFELGSTLRTGIAPFWLIVTVLEGTSGPDKVTMADLASTERFSLKVTVNIVLLVLIAFIQSESFEIVQLILEFTEKVSDPASGPVIRDPGVTERIGVAPSWLIVTAWLVTPGPDKVITADLAVTARFSSYTIWSVVSSAFIAVNQPDDSVTVHIIFELTLKSIEPVGAVTFAEVGSTISTGVAPS